MTISEKYLKLCVSTMARLIIFSSWKCSSCVSWFHVFGLMKSEFNRTASPSGNRAVHRWVFSTTNPSLTCRFYFNRTFLNAAFTCWMEIVTNRYSFCMLVDNITVKCCDTTWDLNFFFFLLKIHPKDFYYFFTKEIVAVEMWTLLLCLVLFWRREHFISSKSGQIKKQIFFFFKDIHLQVKLEGS